MKMALSCCIYFLTWQLPALPSRGTLMKFSCSSSGNTQEGGTLGKQSICFMTDDENEAWGPQQVQCLNK